MPAPTPALARLAEHAAIVLAVGAFVGSSWLAAQRSWAPPPTEIRRDSFAVPAEFTLKVDINRDSWRRFTLIPGIGEGMAKRIVEHREKFGPFRTVDELMLVHGVGEKGLNRWRPFLTLSAPPSSASGFTPPRRDH